MLLLASLTYLSYGRTLAMYFWKDDSALMFKAQNPAVEAGFWGKGVFGEGPYRHIVEPFALLYPVFGLEPSFYFAVGLIFYFAAAVCVYVLALTLFQRRLPAVLTAAIFASGYIASDTVYGLTNSLQTSRGIAMAALLVTFFVQYLRSKNILWYILAVVLFFFTLDTVYIRSHGLIFVIAAADIFFSPFKLSPKWFLGFIARQVPFVFIFYKIYLQSVSTSFAARHAIADIAGGDITPLLSPVVSLGNLFIPDVLLGSITPRIKSVLGITSNFPFLEVVSCLLFLLVLAVLTLLLLKKKNSMWKILPFAFIWIVANIVLYFAFDTKQVLGSTHRYFSYSFVGFALFVSAVCTATGQLFFSKRQTLVSIALAAVLIVSYLRLGAIEQNSIIAKKSIPARRFFSTLKQTVPILPKGSLVYFDIFNSPEVKNEFDDFFGAGSMPESTVIAIYYDLDRYDIQLSYSFDDVFKKLKEKALPIDRLYTFYYDLHGLHNTTDTVRSQLMAQHNIPTTPSAITANVPSQEIGQGFSTQTQIQKTDQQTTGINPIITVSFDPPASSQTPLLFEFEMAISPQDPTDIVMPYRQGDSDRQKIVDVDLERSFAYLESRSSYLKTASVSASSSWQDQVPKNLLDGRIDTTWMTNRVAWGNEQQTVTVDLGSIRSVSKVLFINGNTVRTPTSYVITTSQDQKQWEIVKKTTGQSALPNNAVWEEEFPAKYARFVRIELLESSGKDAPQLAEIEVVEDRFRTVHLPQARELQDHPFAIISSLAQWQAAANYISKQASIRYFWKRDKDNGWDSANYQDFPIIVDGQFHSYRLFIPAGGTQLEQMKFDNFNFPARIFIRSAKIVTASIL